jgi:hypothetical protein
MCNCLKEVSEKLEMRLKDKIEMKNVYSFDHIGFDNMVFSFGDEKRASMSHVLTIPFSIKYFRKKKDGTRMNNVTTEKTSLSFSFCPFCGKKYPTNS